MCDTKFIGPPELKLRLGGRQEVSGERNPSVAKFRVSLHLPPAPFHLSSGPVLRVLLGIGEGLRRLLNFEKPPNAFAKGLFFNIENSSINQVSI